MSTYKKQFLTYLKALKTYKKTTEAFDKAGLLTSLIDFAGKTQISSTDVDQYMMAKQHLNNTITDLHNSKLALEAIEDEIYNVFEEIGDISIVVEDESKPNNWTQFIIKKGSKGDERKISFTSTSF